MLDFKKWKRFIGEKEKFQYVKNTAVKKTHSKGYIYYFCHRSFAPKISNKVINITPLQSEIKFGNDKVCVDGTHGLNG